MKEHMAPDEIRAIRQSLGLNQADFAERLGVSKDTVNSWEQGRRTPCCEHMEAHIRRQAPRGRKGK